MAAPSISFFFLPVSVSIISLQHQCVVLLCVTSVTSLYKEQSGMQLS